MKKYIYKKQKGQALLVVMVIGALTTLILFALANRVMLDRENIRRSGAFDNAITLSENKINEVIKKVRAEDCVVKTTVYTKLECIGLADDDADVFGKLGDEFVPITMINNLPQPVTLFMDQDGDTRSDGVNVTCTWGSGSPVASEYRFMVSRVYLVNNTEYKIDKGISNCGTANSTSGTTNSGNITFFNNAGQEVKMGNISRSSEPNSSLQFIRVRPLDGTPGEFQVKVENRQCPDTNGVNCKTMGATGSYDFIIVGKGGLGSDNIVQFEIPVGDKGVSPAFDFVYFGEDL